MISLSINGAAKTGIKAINMITKPNPIAMANAYRGVSIFGSDGGTLYVPQYSHLFTDGGIFAVHPSQISASEVTRPSVSS